MTHFSLRSWRDRHVSAFYGAELRTRAENSQGPEEFRVNQ